MIGMLASLALGASSPAGSECNHDREALLALEVVEFDQTEGSGWRPLYDAHCFVEAAELLRDWQEMHGDTFEPEDPRSRLIWRILAWHEAQMWAFAGRNDRALPIFLRSYARGEGPSDLAWNHYVDGTRAFIRRDRPALLTAIARLGDVPKPPGWDQALGADGQPISLPWPQNLDVLEGLLRCWDQPYDTAYLCRDIPERS